MSAADRRDEQWLRLAAEARPSDLPAELPPGLRGIDRLFNEATKPAPEPRRKYPSDRDSVLRRAAEVERTERAARARRRAEIVARGEQVAADLARDQETIRATAARIARDVVAERFGTRRGGQAAPSCRCFPREIRPAAAHQPWCPMRRTGRVGHRELRTLRRAGRIVVG